MSLDSLAFLHISLHSQHFHNISVYFCRSLHISLIFSIYWHKVGCISCYFFIFLYICTHCSHISTYVVIFLHCYCMFPHISQCFYPFICISYDSVHFVTFLNNSAHVLHISTYFFVFAHNSTCFYIFFTSFHKLSYVSKYLEVFSYISTLSSILPTHLKFSLKLWNVFIYLCTLLHILCYLDWRFFLPARMFLQRCLAKLPCQGALLKGCLQGLLARAAAKGSLDKGCWQNEIPDMDCFGMDLGGCVKSFRKNTHIWKNLTFWCRHGHIFCDPMKNCVFLFF